ncbi:hypothetical protein V1290_007142 [Bradyrhizobium sp. AZCC 1578]
MKWLGIAFALILGALVLYDISYPSLTLRYRLVLEAEVDGEPKIGSSVVEVTYSKQSRFAGQSDLAGSYRGEAVVLDLGSRGTLFALLNAGSDSRSMPESIILRAFNFDGGAFPGPTVDEGLKKLRQLPGKRELPLTSLPMLVRFRDLNDPMTVEKVDPLDISKSFGGGARLVRATLEIVPVGIWPLNSFGMTGEPITTGVEKRLPWLIGMTSNIDGTSSTSSTVLSNVLHVGDFKGR